MCGIIGCIGKNNAIEILLSGLEKLEYRGYDSAGIAFINENKISLYKDIGKVKNLKSLVDLNSFSSYGIGHTRWATHGKPSKVNAHPHLSYDKRFALVHNGVIENHDQLRKKYLSNINFVSQTDTEVISNLLSYFAQSNDVLTSLKLLKQELKGSYTLVIIDSQSPNTLFFMKKQTPLLIGVSEGENIIASDAVALPKYIEQQIILLDGDYGYITDKDIIIYDKNNLLVSRPKIKITKIEFLNSEKIYHYHMEKEIHEQPLLIEEMLNRYFIKDKSNIDSKIITNLKNADKIYIIACGSSYYSGNLGKYYFEKYLNKPVEVILASEAIYNFPLLSKKPYFIFVSQSGETLDVINVIKLCQTKMIPTLGITNSFNSTVTYLCDNILYLYAGREIAVASTKAFLGQSLLFLMLSKQDKLIKNDLICLKKEIENILSSKEKINTISKKIIKYHDVFYLGKSLDYMIALEGALKLKEISYLHAEAFASGELKHGSLALIDENTAVIGINTQDKLSSIFTTNISETTSRGAESFIISKSTLTLSNNDLTINNLPDDIIPLAALIYVQLIAFYCAKNKGNEIDTPRNLAKSVTVE